MTVPAPRQGAMVKQPTHAPAPAAPWRKELLDPLTGLPNRACLTENLGRIFRQHPDARVGVCFVRLDECHAIVDRRGLDVGEDLIVAVAQRIASVVTPAGHIVARLGGNDFVIVCPGEPAGTAQTVADQVVRALQCPVTVSAQRVRASITVGVAEQKVGQTTACDLIRRAMTAGARPRALERFGSVR